MYGMFSSGLIPMGYALLFQCVCDFVSCLVSVLFWPSFCFWFVGGFWPILTHEMA